MAPARAALAGNPSDGYGGAVLAVTLPGWRASAARAGRDALEAGDRYAFARCVDRTFELRSRMLELDPRCAEMVADARRMGAAANYTGSGGAIIAACHDQRHAGTVADALERAGCDVAHYAPEAP